MASHITDARLEAFALGTLHTVLPALLVVTLAYRGGDLGNGLAELSTALGMALFGLLWLVSCWCTAGALRGVAVTGSVPLGVATERGTLWGGVAGVLVLLGLVATAAALGAAELLRNGADGLDPRATLAGAALVALACAVATPFAFAAGAVIGLAHALLDWLVVRAADHAMGFARQARR